MAGTVQAPRRFEPHGETESGELLNDTVLLQAPAYDDGDYPLLVEEAQGANMDAIFHRLKRERVVLLCDLNSVKAKFELTLQTLRATLRLNANASWADVLEHAEALGNSYHPSSAMLPGTRSTLAEAEAEQVELERETLEEKLEAQASHITRLRELLQKQQRLLDMTAGQIQEQHQQSKRQAEQNNSLEQQQVKEQEKGAAQAVKIDALSIHNEQLAEELKIQRDLAAQLEEQLRSEVQQRHENSIRQESSSKREADRVAEIREQLAARESDCKRYRADLERQKQVIKELTEHLSTQNEAYDALRDKVEIQEQEHRRQYSYMARTPPEQRRLGASGDDAPSPQDSATPSLASARGPRSARHEQSNGSLHGSSSRLEGVPWGVGSQASSARGIHSARQAPMDDDERDAFLSHFPMAQRTERQMRNRLDGERRKKLSHR